MDEISCLLDGGELHFDLEETRLNGITSIYTCQKCGNMYSLKLEGTKKPGWKTNKTIKAREFLDAIPF